MNGCMETDKLVQILLSTYNGEKYLREQLNSYLKLDGFEQCCVLIRDDGSTDGTREILREYEQKYGFEVFYGENLGVTGSYQWLLEHCNPSCEYFALSDQDDVWMPHKLKIALPLLAQQSSEIPVLFASRSCITNAELKPIGYSIAPKRGISFFNAMVQNVLPGHTQILNRKLCMILAEKGMENAHVVDWWIYLVASAIGEVVFSDQITVLHRQHGENAVGYRLMFLDGFLKRLSDIRKGKGNSISVQLFSFYEKYQQDIPEKYVSEISHYLYSDSLYYRFKYILNRCVYRQKKWEDNLFAILYLLGKYRLII